MDSALIGQIPGIDQAPPLPGLGGAMPLAADPGGMAGPQLAAGLPDLPLPVEPKYRSWYKEEKKPTIEWILSSARDLDTEFLERNLAIAEAIAAIRMQVSGAFREDVRDIESGRKAAYISPALYDEWNVLWAMIAGIDPIFNKQVRHQDQAIKSQMMEDVAYEMWERSCRQWVFRGDMDLKVARAKVLTIFGFLVTRITVDLYDADYPFDYVLIDPATVYPQYDGKRGLRRVFRVFKARLADVVHDFYGDDADIPADIRRKLVNNTQKELDTSDGDELEFVEYWDRTWCAVIATDGTVIKKPTRHDYGIVPFCITFGPGGEPNLMQPQNYYNRRDANGRIQPYASRAWEQQRYKAVSAIRGGMIRNAQEEALAALILEEIRKAANPPVIWKRTLMAAANKHRVVIDGRRNGLTELFANEEEIEPFPTAPNPGLLQMMLQFMGKNNQTNSIPMSLLGQINQSNVSGTAISSAADSGMDKIAPWIAAMETDHEQCFALQMELWRNAGHLSRYLQDSPTQLMVPNRRVRYAVHEITPELIDEMGYEISCRLTKLKNGELLPMGNALKLLVEAGFMSKRTASDYLGITDYDREQELWRNERSVDLAFQEPDFMKVFTIPLGIQQSIAAMEGNPEAQALMETLLDEWMGIVAAPARMQAQGGGMAGPAAMGPGGPPGQMTGGPGQPGGMVNPNTAAGVSYPQMGQGPGSVTGVQGGPTGPMPSGEGNPMAGL